MLFGGTSPQPLLRGQLTQLETYLSGIREGNEAAIHNARVTTRRIRELLPLTAEWRRRDALEELETSFRRIGRSLGRVRDVDVEIALLRYLETRIPTAAPSLVIVGQRHEGRRVKRLRHLIKTIERLDFADTISGLRAHPARRYWQRASTQWRRLLNRMITARAQACRDAVNHATGVYFPNRVHAARIAIKKYRYAREILDAVERSSDAADIRELKKAQDVLGELHDRQSLIDELMTIDPDHVDANLMLVAQVAAAEGRDLHQKYLDRRERVLAVCDRGLRGAATLLPAGAVALSAVALSSGLLATRAALPWGAKSTDEETDRDCS